MVVVDVVVAALVNLGDDIAFLFCIGRDSVVATTLLTLILCAGNTTSTDHDFHSNRSDNLGRERAANWSVQNKIKPALTKTI